MKSNLNGFLLQMLSVLKQGEGQGDCSFPKQKCEDQRPAYQTLLACI